MHARLLPLTFIFIAFIFILPDFFSCRPSNSRADAVDPAQYDRTLEELLLSTDTLPSQLISDRVAQFPEAIQDSFFVRRLRVLEEIENDDAVKETLRIFRKLQPESMLAKGLEGLYYGIFAQYAGKFDSAEIRYGTATKAFESIGAGYYLAQTLDSHAGSKNTQARSEEAIAMHYRAVEILKKMGDIGMRMKVLTHLANDYNLMGNFDQAILLLGEPTAYYKGQKDTINLAYILSMKGTVYFAKKDYEQALRLYKEALTMRQQARSKSGIEESLFHVGRTLLKLNGWQEALDTLRVAETAVHKSTDKQGQAYIESGIGEALYNLDRFEEAEHYLVNSLDLSVRRRQYPSALLAAQRLSIVRKEQKRYAEALEYHEQYVTFKDTVLNREKEKISRELTVQYETHEKELKIAALQRENRLATQRNWWIGGSLVALSVIGLCILRLRATRKQQHLALENAQSEAKTQLLAQELEIKNLELSVHTNRLADYARMMIERNEQLQELTQQIQSEKTALPPQDLNDLFNLVILTDADWEKFQQYFNHVYPGFIIKLRTQYPDLSPAEIRLVLLDKMGLSQKEASAILGISIDSVKKGRYRLKKKYHLTPDDLAEGLMG